MKYIRTKDGIFKVWSEDEKGFNPETKPFYETEKEKYFLHPFIPKERVLKQSFSIDDLCDCYVEEYGDYKTVIGSRYDLFKGEDGSWRKEVGLKEHKIVVYGAIWIKNGLKYVAKMNDKGELELL